MKQGLRAKILKYEPDNVALICDQQVDTLKFIASIKCIDDSQSEMIIQIITENQSRAVNHMKIHSLIFHKRHGTIAGILL